MDEQTTTQVKPHPIRSGRNAALVAAGILASRLFGLLRDRLAARYFGLSDVGDAIKAALRIPNLLQNLFGEGVLSASFIPVFANTLAKGNKEEANRIAGAVLSLLSVILAGLVLIGVLATPLLIDLIAPGFVGAKRELAIVLVRILFPGAALLVLSAWCLGILNSHRKFFLSYAAPVAWNLAIIATLLIFSRTLDEYALAVAMAWGSVLGAGLQIAVQLPVVFRLLGRLRLSFGHRVAGVRSVVVNFVPAFMGRGVVQLSAYIDTLIASFLPMGAVTALANAQTIYLLPVSLFGMSISAAELPEMARMVGSQSYSSNELVDRLGKGLRRIVFLVVPSAVAFLVLGDIVTAIIYQNGRFVREDTLYVWGILAAAGVGLLATTMARLFASTFYALQDTKTPLRFAVVRVLIGSALAYFAAFQAPALLSLRPQWGAAGIALASGLAGWIELFLLRAALVRRIGTPNLSSAYLVKLWGLAIVAALPALAAKLVIGVEHPLILGFVALSLFGCGYLAGALALQLPEARTILNRVLSTLRTRR